MSNDITIPTELPLLAVREVVIFSEMVLTFFIGREESIAAIESALAVDNRQLFITAQKNIETDQPGPEDLYQIGTVSTILRHMRLPDGRIKILVQGQFKAKVVEFTSTEPFFKVRFEVIEDSPVTTMSEEIADFMSYVRNQCLRLLAFQGHSGGGIVGYLEAMDGPGRLADAVIASIKIRPVDAQEVLEAIEPLARLEKVNKILTRELEGSTFYAKLDSEDGEEVDPKQREHVLRKMLKAIKRELGEDREQNVETEEYRAKFRKARLPKEAAAEAARQLSRLEGLHQDAAEATIIRSYLDWISDLPWSVSTRDHLDLAAAKKVLDSDHFNLQKVKDRILEYLAVMKLNHRQKGPIICFLGPPGVGKTSLGQSIAKAMGRKFVRLSLGGLKDEAEIRGHRRTYVGALPGRILQSLKTAGSNNPVFMLDEIDKIGSDFRGDPASALLEVLDPEQNSHFSDHYLNLSFDLSKVMFITTANFLDPIPEALEDRMEVIYLSGYTNEEKVAISKKFLIPKLISNHGLKAKSLTINDSAIKTVINSYTQEAGLRGMERKLATICRKVARRVAEGYDRSCRVTQSQIPKYLGPPEILPEPVISEGQPGVVTGLAWTGMGGELMYVEARTMPGKGNLTLTGQLGEVMRESAQTVLAFARAHSYQLGLEPNFYDEVDIHIHLPVGGVPKDGPSAGVTLLVALFSALTGQPAPRDIAMTGEITLRGQVMGIGGLKEKSLAALRAGIKKVIIPKQNLKDLVEIPSGLRRQIQFLTVDNVQELLVICFPSCRFRLDRPTTPGRLRLRPKPRSRRRRPL
ncbi:MAG: endopeptidase La [Deltaproteobacteria bacterium]|nr:endopeptidase La [Deltaproteobacteria bacterium]